MFQTHDNCEHLAMMDKTIGSPPNSFAKKCKHPFYTRVGTNYVLNWDENTEDGVYVKTNCKPLEVLFELNDLKFKNFSRNTVFGLHLLIISISSICCNRCSFMIRLNDRMLLTAFDTLFSMVSSIIKNLAAHILIITDIKMIESATSL